MIRCSARLSAIWLLAIRCLLVLLLLSLFRTFSCSPVPAPVSTALVRPTGLTSSHANGAVHKGKCQFDLIDQSSSIEAESFRYQHLGCAHCEYNIRAPGSLVILLNFTDIHSLTDMSVEPGAQQHLQEATHTTTTTATTKTTARPPPPPPIYDGTRPGGSENDDKLSYAAASTSTQHAVPTSEGGDGGVRTLNRTEQSVNGSGTFAQHRHKNKGVLDASDLPDDVKNHRNADVNISGSPENVNAGIAQTNKVVSHTTDHHNSESDNNSNNNNIDNKSDDTVSPTSHGGSVEEVSSTLHTNTLHTLGTDIVFDERVGDNHCSLKLIIEVVNSSARPQVICWQSSWQRRVPLVYRYNVPVKVTYIWDAHSHSGFSLHFSFLQAKAEVDCEFHCNNHLCLLRDQLCNGYNDCPDGTDEEKTTCLLARQEDHQDSSPTQMKVIIIVSVILLLLVIVSVFMISRRRYRHGGARSGGRGSLLHPPHSQSSEVFRSTSSSMHDSGQYDALVQDSQRHQDTESIAHCSESHHLLQQQQQLSPTGVRNPPTQVHRPHQQVMCPTNLTRDGAAGKGWLPQQLQLPHTTTPTMEFHADKHQRRQPKKQPSPHEMYPPHIPVSGDGEEGYATAQRSLHSKQQLVRNWQEENGVFRPPPNRTIYDCNTPPPPYSSTPPSLKSFDSAGAVNVLRPVRGALAPQSCTTPRCHSLSCHH